MKQSKKSLSRRRFLGYSGFGLGAILAGPKASGGTPLDTVITRVAIYPGIGIARVGNSAARDDFYIGPETIHPSLTTEGQMRDANGAMKRQAARFRIYGYNAKGEVVGELTAKDARIEWSVELANKKSSWYRFIAAMDLAESRDMKCVRRNAGEKDRARLNITPGSRTITGAAKSGVRFDSGKFRGVAVDLGELRTDRDGRLLVLGGKGRAGSPAGAPIYDPEDGDTFNNADGWWDDISDGPVSATVKIGGKTFVAESAWVAVAPPNYAPDVIGWRTMYDLLMDTYAAAGMVQVPQETSFTRDVLPILQRLSGLQWVNKGFADLYAKGGELDFSSAAVLQKLSRFPTEPDGFENFRKHIYESFRFANSDASNRRLWPMIYGDAFGTFENSRHENLILSDRRAMHLKRWAEGNFVNDYNPSAPPPRFSRIEDVPLNEQPAMLNQSALHFCLADAFHPGCELTWPMRHASLYRAPFRIRRRLAAEVEADYGERLSQEIVLRKGGPLFAQGAGDLTRWMAIPWHGDTVFCRSGYDPDFDPYLPTFWPARVPNHVLTEEDYNIVIDESRPREERMAAFKRRASWTRSLRGSAPQQMVQMIGEFDAMGVLEARRGVRADSEFPAVMLVESVPARNVGRSERGAGQKTLGEELVLRSGAPMSAAQEAGWESEEQLEEFRNIRMRGKKKKGKE